jgi:hypothetical protein
VATIPGFLGAEKWVSFDDQTKNSMYYFETMDAMFQLSRFDAHREAKGNIRNGMTATKSWSRRCAAPAAIATLGQSRNRSKSASAKLKYS